MNVQEIKVIIQPNGLSWITTPTKNWLATNEKSTMMQSMTGPWIHSHGRREGEVGRVDAEDVAEGTSAWRQT